MAYTSGLADSGWCIQELMEPALMMFTRTNGGNSPVGGDAPIDRHASHGPVEPNVAANYGASHVRGKPPQPPPPPRTPRGQDVERKATVKDGAYLTTRTGKPLCEAFQSGNCHGKSLTCPKDHKSLHLCGKCLKQGHGSAVCTSNVTPYEQSKFQKGRGKKKGFKPY